MDQIGDDTEVLVMMRVATEAILIVVDAMVASEVDAAVMAAIDTETIIDVATEEAIYIQEM